MYSAITACRVCGNTNLIPVLNLGVQSLTGVFPNDKDKQITAGPLQLVKCSGHDNECGLLQLAHSYDLDEMYGENYGYRSGLNPSMVKHLSGKVKRICTVVDLQEEDVVLDIGSNDGTTLAAYEPRCVKVGIDPTAKKFRQFYPKDVTVIEDFFSAARYREAFPNRSAKVVTSFSMFYDLEHPLEFVQQVAEILSSDGIWVFEQSYMPTMLERNSYDTVCHEHLEYYALKQIQWMLSRSDLKIVDIEFNDVNGGSFSVTAARTEAPYPEYPTLAQLLASEIEKGLDSLDPYVAFQARVVESKDTLRAFVEDQKRKGKRVACLGASTKGNVILQYCGFTPNEIDAVGEVNPDKYGCYTPGTLIPIVDEHALLASTPDYVLVLPWHFRSFFLDKYQNSGTSLVFPLPDLEVINAVTKPETNGRNTR